jgi:hypothetical protein
MRTVATSRTFVFGSTLLLAGLLAGCGGDDVGGGDLVDRRELSTESSQLPDVTEPTGSSVDVPETSVPDGPETSSGQLAIGVPQIPFEGEPDTSPEVAAAVEGRDCEVTETDGHKHVSVEIFNGSAATLNVFTRVVILDANGDELKSGKLGSTGVVPDERLRERESLTEVANEVFEELPAACEIVEVAVNENDLLELVGGGSEEQALDSVACMVTGVDGFGDIEGTLDIANPHDADHHFQASTVFFDDGLRVGAALPTVRDIAPGETNDIPFFTSVPADPNSTTCEIRWVLAAATES